MMRQIQHPHSLAKTPFDAFLLFEQIIFNNFSFFGTSQRWRSHSKYKEFCQEVCSMLEGTQAVYLWHFSETEWMLISLQNGRKKWKDHIQV